MPTLLVILNYIMAYLSGFFFGRWAAAASNEPFVRLSNAHRLRLRSTQMVEFAGGALE